MKKLITPVQNGGFPLANEDLGMIQNEIYKSFYASMLHFTAQTITFGMQTSNIIASASTFSIASGYTFINGDMTYFSGYNGSYPAYVTQDSSDIQQLTFFDGITRDAIETKKLKVVSSAPTGTTAYVKFNTDTHLRYEYLQYRYSKKKSEPFMYAGSLANFDGVTGLGNIDTEWYGFALCNGQNGTVDLQGRFVVGRGTIVETSGTYNYGLNQIGGESVHLLDTTEIPAHNHPAVGSTSSDGGHTHSYDKGQGNRTSGNNSGGLYETYSTVNTSSAGTHSHTVSISTDNTGGGLAHENRPSYYTLAYIQRIY